MVGSRAPLAALALLAALLAPGCTPTCDQTCKKLVSCEGVETAGLSEELCVEDCQQQEALIDYWEDTQLLEQLDASRRCVRDNTCEDIAAGVCYDPDLYPY